MSTQFEYFSGQLSRQNGDNNGIGTIIDLPEGQHGIPLTQHYWKATKDTRILVKETNENDMVIVLMQNTRIHVVITSDEDDGTNTYIDLRYGAMTCVSISDLLLQSNREMIPMTTLAGGRRRIRVRSRQLGSHGTVYSIATDGVNNVGAATFDGALDVPYGLVMSGKGAEVRIQPNHHITNQLGSTGHGTIFRVLPTTCYTLP